MQSWRGWGGTRRLIQTPWNIQVRHSFRLNICLSQTTTNQEKKKPFTHNVSFRTAIFQVSWKFSDKVFQNTIYINKYACLSFIIRTICKYQPHIVTMETAQTRTLLPILLSIMVSLPFINIYELSVPSGFSEHCLVHMSHQNLILQDDL